MSRMPQVTARELIAFLKREGFVEDRQAGSHLTLWHEERHVSVTIPVHTGCNLGRGLAIRILYCGRSEMIQTFPYCHGLHHFKPCRV